MITPLLWESETFAQNQDVTVPDEKLAAVVREALELGETDPITPTELATLTSLDGYSRGIVDLTGLEHATNLTTLVLWGNSISNLTPLARLRNLRLLSLSANSISNVYPLIRLTNLRKLVLNDNFISNVAPLANLRNLRQLYLHANSVSDVAPLAGLTNLRTLDLSDNSISDVRSLAGLTNLEALGLWGNSIPEDLLHAQLREAGLQVETVPGTTSHPVEVTHRRRRLGQPCPVGWRRQDNFGTATRRVIIGSVEVEIDRNNRSNIYKPVAIEIYADPTEKLSDLHGWKLTLAIPYNHPRDYLLTTENSTFNTDGIARIESPPDTPFPMTDADVGGQILPGFDYRLFDENNTPVDFGIACYKESGLAAQLQAIASPRVERYIVIERLDWRNDYYRSEWRVGTPTEVSPAAPTAVRHVLTTSWAALKKQ